MWRASKDTRIGTLPFGYADGYPRNLRGKAMVTIHGKQVPVVGVLCMDQCMVDLGDVPEASVDVYKRQLQWPDRRFPQRLRADPGKIPHHRLHSRPHPCLLYTSCLFPMTLPWYATFPTR